MNNADDIKWTAAASLQSLFWFFALPTLLKPYWEGFWSGYSPLQAQVLLNEIGLAYFAVAALLMVPIYAGNYAFFEQYKISDQEWHWRSEKPEVRAAFWALTKRSCVLFVVNYGCLVPLLTAGKYFVLGDSMSFKTADWPSFPTLAAHNAALTLVHELGFYWAHRLAHHPRVYKYHKVHHEYKQNTILASMHEHPVDYAVTLAAPALLAVVVVRPHSVTLFHWIAWLLVANIDDHCGYAFPWSPVRWFWCAARTDQHEFHHSKNMGCFASKLSVYDTLFDSERPYLAWRAKRLHAAPKPPVKAE